MMLLEKFCSSRGKKVCIAQSTISGRFPGGIWTAVSVHCAMPRTGSLRVPSTGRRKLPVAGQTLDSSDWTFNDCWDKNEKTHQLHRKLHLLTWSYLILPDLTWSYLILPDLTWTQSFTFFNFIVFLMSLISLLLPGKTKDKQTLVKGAKQLKRCDTI